MAAKLSDPPVWMRSTPKPQLESRRFNEQAFVGWLGEARLFDLKGWVDNPRIDIPVEAFKEQHFGREPNTEELLDIMLEVGVGDGDEDNDEDIDGRRTRRNKLLELAESIRLNGVRIPLIVTDDGRILDGNRRYFANLYLYRMTDDAKEKQNYELLPVWALPPGVSIDDEDWILTELNAINACQEKWPYSVVARRVYEDYRNGMSVEGLAQKFHEWTKSRIRMVIEACKVAEEFIEHHEDSLEAKDLAYRKLIWFDALKRSNSKAIEKQEFRDTIFDLVMLPKPERPFSSNKDFVRLTEIYNNPEAWETLTTRVGKEALKQALYIVDRERYEGASDPQSRMKRVNSLLQGIIGTGRFEMIEPKVLQEFHSLSAQVPALHLDELTRATIVLEMIDSFSSKEIARLPKSVSEQLQTTLERLQKQADAYHE